MNIVDEPEDKEWEEIASRAQASRAYDREASARARFSEVTGLCRTCEYALIRRRAYSEVPWVLCTYSINQRVPLDIKECSGYREAGQMHLRDMHQLGIVIDPRKKGGQYL